MLTMLEDDSRFFGVFAIVGGLTLLFGVLAIVEDFILLFGVLAAVYGVAVFFDILVEDEDSFLVFMEMADSVKSTAVLGVLATTDCPNVLNGYSTLLTEC